MKRRLLLIVPAVAVCVILGTVPAAAAGPPEYLALGDSVPFGFNPLVSPSDADGFVGYPEDLASLLDVGVRNATCPGETSGSLISTATQDNGCQAFRSVGDLHVNYQGSQLAYALAFLHAHQHTSLVTITVGANDLFLLLKACNGSIACVEGGLGGVLNNVGADLAAIYTAIRATGYTGEIEAVTYYVTNYADPLQLGLIGALDQVITQVTLAAGGKVANGFAAFGAVAATAGGDSCAAGLLIKLPDGTCNIHPSALGQEILAKAAQAAL